MLILLLFQVYLVSSVPCLFIYHISCSVFGNDGYGCRGSELFWSDRARKVLSLRIGVIESIFSDA